MQQSVLKIVVLKNATICVKNCSVKNNSPYIAYLPGAFVSASLFRPLQYCIFGFRSVYVLLPIRAGLPQFLLRRRFFLVFHIFYTE